jgi:Tol biopolymer transport system component
MALLFCVFQMISVGTAGGAFEKNSLNFICFGKPLPLPADTGVQPPRYQVRKITKLADGTRPDWSADGQFIAYDKKIKGSYELFIMNADGSNVRCLTRNLHVPSEIQAKHKGKATFHPNGKYLLFGAENEYGKHGLKTIPGIGDNHDLWMRRLDVDDKYRRLTKLPKDYAVQYPRFSSDGTRLVWSERYQTGKPKIRGFEYGLWKIKVAKLSFSEGAPQLSDIVELKPGGDGFYEPHGFSPGGNKIIFTAALDPGASQVYGDIYTYDFTTGILMRITDSAAIHDEQALYSPDGKKIALMSGPFIGFLRLGYKTDIYLMDSDGNNRVRLTYFNQPGKPEYTGGSTLIDKIAWSPDGNALVSAYHVVKKGENTVFKIMFEGSLESNK